MLDTVLNASFRPFLILILGTSNSVVVPVLKPFFGVDILKFNLISTISILLMIAPLAAWVLNNN